jgi:NADPH-dependent curcumin reductase CurA
MPASYQSVVLAERPGAGPIIPGKTFALKSATRVDESDLKDGQFEVQTLYLSLDPAMRGWLNGK